MLFEMLAGRLPFVASTSGDLIAMHITREPPDLGHCAPNVSESMTSLVARMLAKSPEERPTMSTVEERLAQIEQELLAGTAVSTRTRRRQGQLLRLCGIGLAVLGGAAGLWQAKQLHGRTEVARMQTAPRAAGAPVAPAPLGQPGPQALKDAPQPPPAASVRWALRTVPAGARIVRTADQVLIGTTPWQVRVEKGDGGVEVTLELAGFAPQRVLLSRQQDSLWELSLQSLAAERRPPGGTARARPAGPERLRERMKPAGPPELPASPAAKADAPPAATAPPVPAAAAAAAAPAAAASPSSPPPAAKSQPQQPRDDDIEVPALH